MSAVVWNAFASTAQLTTITEILVFLPLTLATLSQSAFLILSLLLTVHSVIHSTLKLILPTFNLSSGRILSLPSFLPFAQLPIHPFLLLLSFNLFSSTTDVTWLTTIAQYWGTFLRYSTPVFAGLEGLASLITIQSAGLHSKHLAAESEFYQFLLLILSSAAYVIASVWLWYSFPDTPVTAMLFGCAITSLLFLTALGFAMRRTNVVESSGVALFLAYNVWQCMDEGYTLVDTDFKWPAMSVVSASPLLENMIPHLQTAFNFITQSLPRPVLGALLFRLTILHLGSRIVRKMSAVEDGWEDEVGVGGGWEGRPSTNLTSLILTYRQTIFITVYSHLLLIDHYSDVWWRWTNVFFILAIWGVELLVWGSDDDDQHWKVD